MTWKRHCCQRIAHLLWFSYLSNVTKRINNWQSWANCSTTRGGTRRIGYTIALPITITWQLVCKRGHVICEACQRGTSNDCSLRVYYLPFWSIRWLWQCSGKGQCTPHTLLALSVLDSVKKFCHFMAITAAHVFFYKEITRSSVILSCTRKPTWTRIWKKENAWESDCGKVCI